MLRIFTHSISQSGSINTFVSTWTLWAVVGRVICAAARKTRRKTFRRVQLSDSINVARKKPSSLFSHYSPDADEARQLFEWSCYDRESARSKKLLAQLIGFCFTSHFSFHFYLHSVIISFFSSCFLRPLGCVERPNWCWWDQFKRN